MKKILLMIFICLIPFQDALASAGEMTENVNSADGEPNALLVAIFVPLIALMLLPLGIKLSELERSRAEREKYGPMYRIKLKTKGIRKTLSMLTLVMLLVPFNSYAGYYRSPEAVYTDRLGMLCTLIGYGLIALFSYGMKIQRPSIALGATFFLAMEINWFVSGSTVPFDMRNGGWAAWCFNHVIILFVYLTEIYVLRRRENEFQKNVKKEIEA